MTCPGAGIVNFLHPGRYRLFGSAPCGALPALPERPGVALEKKSFNL
jgi:hypothetical protein